MEEQKVYTQKQVTEIQKKFCARIKRDTCFIT